MATLPFHILVIRSFLPLFGFAVGKTCIVLGSDVAQVAHDIHHFVVTEQAHDPAACLYGFRRFRWSLCWLRPRQHHRHQDQEDGNTSAVGSITDRRADYFPAFYSQAAEFWRKHCVPQGVLYWGAS